MSNKKVFLIVFLLIGKMLTFLFLLLKYESNKTNFLIYYEKIRISTKYIESEWPKLLDWY